MGDRELPNISSGHRTSVSVPIAPVMPSPKQCTVPVSHTRHVPLYDVVTSAITADSTAHGAARTAAISRTTAGRGAIWQARLRGHVLFVSRLSESLSSFPCADNSRSGHFGVPSFPLPLHLSHSAQFAASASHLPHLGRGLRAERFLPLPSVASRLVRG